MDPLNNKDNAASKDQQEASVIKQAIKDDQGLASVAKNITVTVKDGDITLDGQVNTEQQMNLAANTAKALEGKDEVQNHIHVIHKTMVAASIALMVFFSLPALSQASGSLTVSESGGHRRYTEVMVSGNRYYYDQGIYYTGSPDHYVVVDAPVGAVIYNAPVGYEEVEIDGSPYYRYHDVYYRHGFRGYEVVSIDRSRVQKRGYSREHAHDHDNDNRNNHGNDHGHDNDHGRDNDHNNGHR